MRYRRCSGARRAFPGTRERRRRPWSTIGYSPDGRYFAYEEFGTHDGSGAPFAEITIVDLDAEPAVQPLTFAAEGGEDLLLRPIRSEASRSTVRRTW
jgi:predicted secreted protein